MFAVATTPCVRNESLTLHFTGAKQVTSYWLSAAVSKFPKRLQPFVASSPPCLTITWTMDAGWEPIGRHDQPQRRELSSEREYASP